MMALVASVFVAALLGSAHCAAMCGGLACFVGGNSRDPRATAAYNGGRLFSYAVIGALAGAAGAGFDAAGGLVGFARPAAVVAGALMIIWGGATALAAAGVRMPSLRTPAGAQQLLGRLMRAVRERSPAQRGLTLGLLTPLLPCGWLYAFVATAAATGSAPRGAVVMAVFWAGTVPAMAAIGLGAQSALGPFRRRLPAITAAAMVVIGLLTLTGKFSAMSPSSTSVSANGHAHTP